MSGPPDWHLSAYLLDELAPAEVEGLERHLDGSAEARARLDELRRVLPVVAGAARRSVRRRRRRRAAVVGVVAVALAALALLALSSGGGGGPRVAPRPDRPGETLAEPVVAPPTPPPDRQAE